MYILKVYDLKWLNTKRSEIFYTRTFLLRLIIRTVVSVDINSKWIYKCG